MTEKFVVNSESDSKEIEGVGVISCECGSKAFNIVIERYLRKGTTPIASEEYYCARCGSLITLPSCKKHGVERR